MSAPLYTCITCRVGFRTAELQRNHYKSDWHRYNLKLKTVSQQQGTAFLCVSEEEFLSVDADELFFGGS